MINLTSIKQVGTTRPDLFAFRITGEVSREDMTAMADYMNDVFDRHDSVDMLMIFDFYDGAESGASLSWDALKSRFRAISKVKRYVVVGAPDHAEKMISVMDSILPVKAETYDNEAAAWGALDAKAEAT